MLQILYNSKGLLATYVQFAIFPQIYTLFCWILLQQFKTRVNDRLSNVKKTALLVRDGFPYRARYCPIIGDLADCIQPPPLPATTALSMLMIMMMVMITMMVMMVMIMLMMKMMMMMITMLMTVMTRMRKESNLSVCWASSKKPTWLHAMPQK